MILVALAGPIEGAGRPDTANIMGYWNRRARAEAPRLSPSQQNIVDNTLRNGNRRMLLTRWFD